MTRDEMHDLEITRDAMEGWENPKIAETTDALKTLNIGAADALVVIDVQNDFLPGGALAVANGDEIIPVIAEIAPLFETVILTQDWHPADHSSFAANHEGAAPFSMTKMPYGDQVLWPIHCVMGTHGAEIALPEEVMNRAQMVIRKGFRADVDSYSAFVENDQKTITGLQGYLRDQGIKRVFLVGLATDYCVGFSAIDAQDAGFEAVLVEAGCRGIAPDTITERKAEMASAGVTII